MQVLLQEPRVCTGYRELGIHLEGICKAILGAIHMEGAINDGRIITVLDLYTQRF